MNTREYVIKHPLSAAKKLDRLESRIAELEADNTRLKTLADNYYAIAADSNAENAKLRDTVKTAFFACFAWCDEGSQEVADDLIAAALEPKP